MQTQEMRVLVAGNLSTAKYSELGEIALFPSQPKQRLSTWAKGYRTFGFGGNSMWINHSTVLSLTSSILGVYGKK